MKTKNKTVVYETLFAKALRSLKRTNGGIPLSSNQRAEAAAEAMSIALRDEAEAKTKRKAELAYCREERRMVEDAFNYR